METGNESLQLNEDRMPSETRRLIDNISKHYPEWIKSHQSGDTNVLTFGFGAGAELKPLRQVFPNANIFAFDKDRFAIKTGKLVSKKYNLKIDIKQADARDEDAVYLANDLKPNLVVIRTFGVVDDAAVKRMKQTLTLAHKHLEPGGLIYLSTELAAEVENMKLLLKELGLSFKHHRDDNPKPPGAFRENDVYIISN